MKRTGNLHRGVILISSSVAKEMPKITGSKFNDHSRQLFHLPTPPSQLSVSDFTVFLADDYRR